MGSEHLERLPFFASKMSPQPFPALPHRSMSCRMFSVVWWFVGSVRSLNVFKQQHRAALTFKFILSGAARIFCSQAV